MRSSFTLSNSLITSSVRHSLSTSNFLGLLSHPKPLMRPQPPLLSSPWASKNFLKIHLEYSQTCSTPCSVIHNACRTAFSPLYRKAPVCFHCRVLLMHSSLFMLINHSMACCAMASDPSSCHDTKNLHLQS